MNTIRKALRERTVTLGSWIQIGHPVSGEVLARAGYDWLAVDMEHTDIGYEGFTNIARGIKPLPVLARVEQNDTLAIRRVLDAGASGVIVPLVNTREEAMAAVAAAKYPPKGVRGFAYCRPNNYGVDFDEYVRTANDDIAVVVMIESKEGVANIDAILAVDGVDGVFIGPYDMSGSYGVPGETKHPLVVKACEDVVAACARAKKSAGLHVVVPDEAAIDRAFVQGFTFIALGVDTYFIASAAKTALTNARECASQRS
ncbi:MAG: 2,4-dihydroxyhept-2-ene-1,7-dioic acid aldolase [Spirochaetes bacterium]|nr:2,4-dihydroxyhept-2-ene-1,7-dioic acid aldolase [Spirochaetota bacterium]